MHRSSLDALVQHHGFHIARCARVGPTPQGERFLAWLERGQHADMTWMAREPEVRLDPRARMAEARTALCLGIMHHHRRPPDPGGRTGLVARYAWGRDYHNLMGKRLAKLKRSLREQGVSAWGGVDTAPILERSWASAAGLGFGGKNCVQILPAQTSWMFLSVLFIDLDLAPDPPLRDHCGRCQRCLSACPTGAFRGPRDLDARACIAYWTIESAELPPASLRPGFGRWVLGCDVCQEVCPHNAAPPDPEEDDLLPRHAYLDLDALLHTPDDDLLRRFAGTPIRRPGAAGLKRNALIALGNRADPGAGPAIEAGLTHDSPVVRGAAVWALGRQSGAPPLTWRDDHPTVRAELDALRRGAIPPAP